MIKLKTLIKRYGCACSYCGIQTSLSEYNGKLNMATRDHRVPKALGGSNKPENLILSCFCCNTLKGCMSEEEFRNSKQLAERIAKIAKRKEKNKKKRQRYKKSCLWRPIQIPKNEEQMAQKISEETETTIRHILERWKIPA